MLCLKWPKLLKAYFYVDILNLFAEQFIPAPLDIGHEQLLHILLTYVIFWLGYFHFWIDITLVVLSFVPLYFKRVYLHGDPLNEAIINSLMMLPWHVLNLFFIHWVITKVGFLFIESEVLRRGNEAILDDLQEGVVIF